MAFINFFKNVWFKRLVSILCWSYGALIIWISYLSVFYRVDYVNKVGFIVLNSVVSLVALLLMIYTRKQVITGILSMFMPLFAFPMVLMNYRQLPLIIPIMLVVLTMFFVGRAKETLKTIVGTLYLLLYIVGILGYLLVINLFLAKTNDEVIATYISGSETYRAYVVDVDDNAKGRTEVYVEPNDLDKDYDVIIFRAKGYNKRVYMYRNHDVPTVVWKGDSLYINDNPYEFTIGDRQLVLE